LWVPEGPTVLEVGGRRVVFEASGVLFLFPEILLAMVDDRHADVARIEAAWQGNLA